MHVQEERSGYVSNHIQDLHREDMVTSMCENGQGNDGHMDEEEMMVALCD